MAAQQPCYQNRYQSHSMGGFLFGTLASLSASKLSFKTLELPMA
jgi:hypothetical protein